MDGLAAWTLSWSGHGCSVHWIHGLDMDVLSQDLGMDALANEWVGSMDVGTMQT